MNMQPKVGIFKQKIGTFFRPSSAPRVMLFLPAVLLKLITAGISGAAFILNSGPLYIAGMLLWVAWIVTLFFIALPSTDRWLAGAKGWLKPLSLALTGVLVIVGLTEFAALTSVSREASWLTCWAPT